MPYRSICGQIKKLFKIKYLLYPYYLSRAATPASVVARRLL